VLGIETDTSPDQDYSTINAKPSGSWRPETKQLSDHSLLSAKMKIITIALGVLSLAVSAQAQIGCTLDECVQHYGYGQTFLNANFYTFCGPKTDFHGVCYFIAAAFVDGKVSWINYGPNRPSTDKMFIEDAKYLLKNSALDVVWNYPSANAENTEIVWSGSINGVVQYFAHLKGTLSLEIVDESTNAGGVIGAKREIINGQSVTVLPLPED
jgi:hypothetical protein